MAKRWVVTATGQDRPGIVAGVTEVLYALGCNLEDSAMTRLEAVFAVMLIFTAPPSLSRARLERAFQKVGKRLKLTVVVSPLGPQARGRAAPGAPYIISVYGADRPGIVFHVSQRLASLGVNITDVETHRSARRKSQPSLYLMLLEVELPPRVTAPALESHLKRMARELGVEMSLRSAEPAVL